MSNTSRNSSREGTDSSGPIRSSLADYPGMNEIIVEFVEGMREDVEKMREFVKRKDVESLRRVVHQLRGAGGGYGFDAVTEGAIRVEESIVSGDFQSIAVEVERLIAVIRRIEGFEAHS